MQKAVTFNALDEMSKLVKDAHTASKQIAPKGIASNLRAIGRFRLGRQEDSHEFIINFLDKMETAILAQYEG